MIDLASSLLLHYWKGDSILMTKKKNAKSSSSNSRSGSTKKSAERSSDAKSKSKTGAGADRAPSPGTLMRAHGHKLVQMWVSKQLQSAILDRARAKGVRISDVLRETVGKEAEKWSGAAVGSLQTLRFVGGGVSAGAGKNGANTATKTNTKSKVVKPVKVKSSAPSKSTPKPARKASPRSSAARGGTKSAADVVAVAGSGDAAAETVAE